MLRPNEYMGKWISALQELGFEKDEIINQHMMLIFIKDSYNCDSDREGSGSLYHTREKAYITSGTDLINWNLRIDFFSSNYNDIDETFDSLVQYTKKNHITYRREENKSDKIIWLSLFYEQEDGFTDRVYLRYNKENFILSLSYVPDEASPYEYTDCNSFETQFNNSEIKFQLPAPGLNSRTAKRKAKKQF